MAYNTKDVTTKRQSRFFVLSILISILLSLTAVLSYFTGFSGILSGLVNIITYPITYCTSAVSDGITGIGKYFGDVARLKEENMLLKAQNNELIGEIAGIEALKAENEQLYSYLELKREYNKLSLVNTKIISRGSGNFLTSFTVDKGTMHGVKKNMPIITSSGILGIITEEGPLTSRAVTLISHNSSAGVYLTRSGTPGILQGDYNLSVVGQCKITGLPIDTDVKIGDHVTTAGTGEIFPGELSVGNVAEIQRDATTQTLTLIITPTCDLVNEDAVMIVTDFERIYDVTPE